MVKNTFKLLLGLALLASLTACPDGGGEAGGGGAEASASPAAEGGGGH